MQAVDVMTSEVVSVEPEMTVREAAALFAEHEISGAPVLDAQGHLRGIISDADLLHRVELGTEKPRRSWWHEMLSSRHDASAYIKEHGRLVKDVMTEGVITVDEATPLDEVANRLEIHHIRRVPVMRGDQVVGIVSRANLVQALALAPRVPNTLQAVSDREIRAMLMGEIAGRNWAMSGRNIIVQNGVVHLFGYYVWSPDQVQAMRVAAESIPGVKAVEDHTCDVPAVMGM
ncbi:CBS domain-containing protein [Paraburkholderia sp. A1RI-2L]|uniref:CBS domain-containing protein n=1 Tax=Paraburkholderia sp. A1RI-2L TaxID=3028367 RepID=UPI003B827A1D